MGPSRHQTLRLQATRGQSDVNVRVRREGEAPAEPKHLEDGSPGGSPSRIPTRKITRDKALGVMKMPLLTDALVVSGPGSDADRSAGE